MEDERHWIERCLDGDAEAFAPLVARYGDRIHSVAWRITRSRDDAGELAQEVFLRAYAKLGSFDRERPFAAWLYRITVNLARDRLRRRARGEPTAVPELSGRAGDLPSPASLAATAEESERLREAVRRLDDESRRLIEMRYFEELDMAEIAEASGIARGSLKVRLFRIRQRLLEELRGEGIE